MTNLQTIIAVAAALTVGTLLAEVDPAQAQLGTGSNALGGGGEAIGQGAPDPASEARSAAPRVFGTCITNRTAFRTQTNQSGTNSTTFVTMPNTHLPVTHAAGCLIVDFAGEVLALQAANKMTIRAWTQGIGAAQPPEAIMGHSVVANEWEARSMRFVFPNVPAGTHTVRIEWRSETGSQVATEFRTLTVQYR